MLAHKFLKFKSQILKINLLFFAKFKTFTHSQELTTKIWLRLQLSSNFRAEIARS